ncbi:MAG: AN1-like Zinc finger [Promethearchaeota archaeon]|nr:MAG: AN1-like Zinc finger [Candidatus Lokiarchaeota archaeon]
MAHCEFCGEEIGYLPFRCKYCGGVYCKKHRLPENHECTFEKKHIPIVPRGPTKPDYRPREFVSTEDSRDIKKYLRRQERQQKRAEDIFQRTMGNRPSGSISTFLIFGIFIMSIIALIVPQYLCLSYYSYFDYYLWTFFTSLFVNYSDSYFGIFFLLILILLFYNIIKIIELRFGSRFLLGLYLFSAFMSAIFFTLLFLPLQLFYYDPIKITFIFGGMAYGGLMGVISFMIFSSLNQEMTFLLFFISIRAKGRILLILLILFRLLPALLYWALYQDFIYFLIYLPDLGGILGSYIVFKYKVRYQDLIF